MAAIDASHTFLRRPGQYEHRCITRHDLGYYGCVVIAGIYQPPAGLPSPPSPDYFFPALRYSLDVHPILSVAIIGAHTKAPQFVRPSQLDLRRHVRIINVAERGAAEEADVIKNAIMECHDRIFRHTETTPLLSPWDVTVVPLPSDESGGATQLLVLFSYSHSHGDGTSGLSFHNSFIRGLNSAQDSGNRQSFLYDTTDRPLLPAFEHVADLTVSWNCLLGAALYDKLPTFIRTSLGLQSMFLTTPNTWLAGPISARNDIRTGLEVLVLQGADLSKLLSACRAHRVRITGVLHQLITRSLREAIAKHAAARTLASPCDIVASTPVNLRHLVPNWAGPTEMAMAVSATAELFPVVDDGKDTPSDHTEDVLWSGARNTGAKLVAAASTLHDQPVALLRYVSDLRSWMTSQVGKARGSSYELSNIMSFDPDAYTPSPTVPSGDNIAATPLKADDRSGWKVGNLYFSQPASVTDSPFNFSVVSRKGGDLAVCLTWQMGVLGVADEQAFAKDVLSGVRSQITSIIDV